MHRGRRYRHVDLLLNDVAILLKQIEKNIELREQASQAANDILAAIGLSTIEEAELALDQAERGALAAENSPLTEQFEEFDQLSRDMSTAYTRLDSHVEKDSEVLVAIGADGSSKVAADLSKGTRFQLYLALRVAGYHEFSRTRPSLPFVADDIMETFDDFRAEEAFRLFAGMANVGQVIYLTHHQHLIDIARRICHTKRRRHGEGLCRCYHGRYARSGHRSNKNLSPRKVKNSASSETKITKEFPLVASNSTGPRPERMTGNLPCKPEFRSPLREGPPGSAL